MLQERLSLLVRTLFSRNMSLSKELNVSTFEEIDAYVKRNGVSTFELIDYVECTFAEMKGQLDSMLSTFLTIKSWWSLSKNKELDLHLLLPSYLLQFWMALSTISFTVKHI